MKRWLALILTAALLLSLLPAALAAEPDTDSFITQPKITRDMALLANGTVYHWYAIDYDKYPGTNYQSDGHPQQIPGLERIVDIAPEMALDADGVVWAWGENSKGQLGDGTTQNRNQPAQVALPEKAVSIASCYQSKAAVTESGALYLWGTNDSGQLGTAADRAAHTAPTLVEGITDVAAVALGRLNYKGYVLALKTDGTVWAWGDNDQGSLGLGSDHPSTSTPTQIPGLENITALSTYNGSCFALAGDGMVWAWGNNYKGQLGHKDGYLNYAYTPLKMTGLTGIVQVAAGEGYTLAVDKDGALWACGLNYFGEFGNRPNRFDSTITNPAIRIDEVTQPAAAASGGTTSILLMADGTIQSPGGSNRFAPDGSTDYFRPLTYSTGLAFYADRYPLRLLSQSGGVAVGASTGLYAPGEEISLGAMPQLGSQWLGWQGEGLSGVDLQQPTLHFAMPNGPVTLTPQFQRADWLVSTPDLAPGGYAVSALRSDGTLWTWGNDLTGQLGDGGELAQPGQEEIRPTAEQVLRFAQVAETPRAIATGTMHSLALTNSYPWAWGNNDYGQLGTGNTDSATYPYRLSSTGIYNIKEAAAGEQFSAVLDGSGKVWYWGLDIINRSGNLLKPAQIPALTGISAIDAGNAFLLALKSDGTVWSCGLDSSSGSGEVHQIQGLENIITISAGGSFALALRQDGTVWAWGSNSYGQLGNGTTESSSTPVQVAGLSQVTMLSAGGEHAAAVTADGTLWTWGRNTSGQLGDSSAESRATPAAVRQSVAFVRAGSAQTFVADSAGLVYACGFNGNGELGSGSLGNVQGFVPVLDGSGVPFSLLSYPLEVKAGLGGTAAQPEQGDFCPQGTQVTVQATPHRGYLFQSWSAEGVTLDDPTANPAVFTMPTNSVTLTANFTPDPDSTSLPQPTLAAGYQHALALNDGGLVWAWGNASDGALGNGDAFISSSLPVLVSFLRDVKAVDAGTYFSLFLRQDGTVWYTGRVIADEVTEPVQVPGLTDITAIAAGSSHALALKSDGTVWAWGWNSVGNLPGIPDGETTPPFQMEGLPPVTEIYAGQTASAVKTEDGSIYVWGNNQYGRFGPLADTGSTTTSVVRTPTKLVWPGEIQSLEFGSDHTIALMADGTVWSCGSNQYGQLGIGSTEDTSQPVQVPGLSGITALSTYSSHTLAVDKDGVLWAWGRGSDGQLGLGNTSNRSTPARVTDGVLQAAAGGNFSLVLRIDGSVLACGSNEKKQIGLRDGGTSTLTPVQTDVTQIGGTYLHFSLYTQPLTVLAGAGGKVTGTCSSASDTLQGSPEPVTTISTFHVAGQPITLTAVADEGQIFDHWSWEGLEDTELDAGQEELTFSMPAAPVTFTAHFRQDSASPDPGPGPEPEPEPGEVTAPTGHFLADVTVPDPNAIPISDGETLAKIGIDSTYPLSGSYLLTCDVDLSGVDNWTPIGTPDAPFTGTFDGGGHVLRGLTITSTSTGCAGLFGAAEGGAVIKNLGVEQADIQLSGLEEGYVGILVGRLGNDLDNYSHPKLSNCYATGSVTASTKLVGATQLYAGGLAGMAAASLDNCYNRAAVHASRGAEAWIGGVAGYIQSNLTQNYQLTRCMNEGPVSADDKVTTLYAGGVFGWLDYELTVSQCRNLAPVSVNPLSMSGSLFCLGGISGYTASTLSDCYNAGSVDCGEGMGYQAYAGGLTGLFYSANSTRPISLSRCYNAGDVAAGAHYTAYAGGLYGLRDGASNSTVEQCLTLCRYVDVYYNQLPQGGQGGVAFSAYVLGRDCPASGGNLYAADLDSRGDSSRLNTNGATALSRADASQAQTYTELGWDTAGLWTVDPQKRDGLPYFVWEPDDAALVLDYDGEQAVLLAQEGLDSVLLWAARYENGQMAECALWAGALTPGSNTCPLPLEQGGQLKISLLNPDTLEPLCYPWSK